MFCTQQSQFDSLYFSLKKLINTTTNNINFIAKLRYIHNKENIVLGSAAPSTVYLLHIQTVPVLIDSWNLVYIHTKCGKASFLLSWTLEHCLINVDFISHWSRIFSKGCSMDNCFFIVGEGGRFIGNLMNWIISWWSGPLPTFGTPDVSSSSNWFDLDNCSLFQNHCDLCVRNFSFHKYYP